MYVGQESIGGKRYFVTFIDDYSRCCRVYFMRHKSEVPEKFKEFEALTTVDCGQQISKLRSGNGCEYSSQEFEAYLKSKGIQHKFSVAYSPQKNGVAERLNCTLMEISTLNACSCWIARQILDRSDCHSHLSQKLNNHNSLEREHNSI